MKWQLTSAQRDDFFAKLLAHVAKDLTRESLELIVLASEPYCMDNHITMLVREGADPNMARFLSACLSLGIMGLTNEVCNREERHYSTERN